MVCIAATHFRGNVVTKSVPVIDEKGADAPACSSARRLTRSSPATVDVSAVLYAEDDHFTRLVDHPVEDAIGAPTR
jgi:hypothetical protein